MYRLIFTAVLVSFLSFTNLVFASGSYNSPERILCHLDQVGKLKCEEINRDYLTEVFTNADLRKFHGDTFHFVSAIAYMGNREVSIYYTYTNAQLKMVKLKTVNSTIRPDLKNGSWVKFNDDIYTCDAGYMNCPITDLPDFS